MKEIINNDNTSLFTVITANLILENISSVVYCNHSKEMREWHYTTEIKGQLDRNYYGQSPDDEELPYAIYSPDGVAMIRKWC